MKKVFTFVIATIVAMGAFAQTNLAAGKASIATSGDAAAGNDGNDGTRWESTHGVDLQVWQVDLGEVTEFNTISIMWEGAYAKAFTIKAGNTVGEDGFITDATDLAGFTDFNPTSFPYVQTIPVTGNYRYVQFYGTQRGTEWGYSFFELGVYNLDEALTLSSMTLTAAADKTPVSTPIALTLKGFDQLGGAVEPSNVQYVLGTPSVGAVENGQFVPAAAGTTTIKAVSGNVESNEVTITVITAEKIDLFTNWETRIYNLGLATSNSKVGAFDDNMGSNWDMLGMTTGNDEASRTYEVGFIADMQALYDIDNISITFEGACSQDFTLAFAGEDGVFGEAAYEGGTHVAGANGHAENFSGTEVKNARYVKFLSTKAATEWSVKIFDFSIYGTKVADITDTESPVISGITTEADEESITLNITTTDNSSKYIVFEINNKYYALGTSVAGQAAPIVIDGLNGNTEYTFSVVAIDGFGNRSQATEVTAKTTGEAFILTAAPAPTADAADVKAIYSNAYTPATAYNYGWWGQATNVDTETVDGDEMLKLTNYNYLGFEFTTDIDLSDMEYIHIDILPMQEMSFGITPIMRNAPNENSQLVGTLNVKQWNSIDLPLSQFGLNYEDNTAFQLKIDRGTAVEMVYVDNIYFYKKAAETPQEVTAITIEAEASEVQAGKTLQITVKDQDGNVVADGLSFSSSNKDVATIDEAGLITAIAQGNATITATYVAPASAAGAPARAPSDAITAQFDLTVTAAPEPGNGQVLTADGHTVTLTGYHYTDTDNYELIITSEEEMVGLGGSFWYLDGQAGNDIRTNMVISDGGHTITITATSTEDPQLYTPLYVLMPGEVNFGMVTIDWIETGAAVAITDITATQAHNAGAVYSIDGRTMQRGNLPAGIYIIDGKKVVVK